MKNAYPLFFIKNKFALYLNHPLIHYYAGTIIGAAGGGMVFGSVVTVLVFVCIWRAVCKET